ncbi:MAG: hypothetical protein JNL70_14190 [Saprospiraceae bacterium]|nr:hypothetical protein [Saprospiraceae bacterium]
MEYLGLLFEFCFLALGIYAYRFATGKIKFSETQRPMAEQFRKENSGWMRLTGLALIAIMSVEIVLHIVQMFR